MSTATAGGGFTLKGWHVLLMFVAFFGIDIAINAVFIARAYNTFPGETSQTPYEDGLVYDKTIKRLQAEKALGWKVQVGEIQPGRLGVTLTDPSGAPLDGLAVSVTAHRPATESGQQTARLTASGAGAYSADTPWLHGAWDLSVTATDRAGHTLTAERRVVAS